MRDEAGTKQRPARERQAGIDAQRRLLRADAGWHEEASLLAEVRRDLCFVRRTWAWYSARLFLILVRCTWAWKSSIHWPLPYTSNTPAASPAYSDSILAASADS